MQFAIVDIETTGGHADANSMTEIAIYIHNGLSCTEEFHTLLKPAHEIPGYITSLTGISNEMVSHAPTFDMVADRIFELTDKAVFVAHNVNFDYSFIKAQFNELGYQWNPKKLCTVRASRKVFPGLKSYSLGNLCAYLSIPIHNRHRAAGDAIDTVSVFEKILHSPKGKEVIDTFLKKGSKEYLLPPNLPKEHFDTLPQKSGVYYFHNSEGRILYIGKAVNIKKRVASHFGGNSGRKQKQDFFRHISAISYTECATELMSLILESTEIKRYWPEYNRAQKKVDMSYGLYDYTDQNGYIRICVEKNRKYAKPLRIYRSMHDALLDLNKIVESHSLCPKLCMIDQSDMECHRYKIGKCFGACLADEPAEEYNIRAEKALAQTYDNRTFAIFDKGITPLDYSCVLVENGKFYGMGYIPIEEKVSSVEEAKNFVTCMKETFTITELIRSENLLQSGKIIHFSSMPDEYAETMA
jgi:DNA polymerase-3 subunit epsilon